MKTIRYIITCSIVLAAAFSCNYLDKQPNEDMTLNEVFSERRYAERFLAATYAHLPIEMWFTDPYGRNPFVGASDEMEMSDDAFCQSMNNGSWSPANVLDAMLWSTIWDGTRKANLFLENIENTPMDQGAKDVWIGEVKFLRAIFHFWGVRAHGSIPIIDRSYGVDEDFTTIVRRPFEECVQFIVDECDDAIELLPEVRNNEELGRPTKFAAMALKARILLYAASPLFNGNNDYRNYLDADQQPLFPLVHDNEKWKLAADAALECITASEAAGHGLYYTYDGNDVHDPQLSYENLFLERWNKEVLFARNVDMDYGNTVEYSMTPNGMGGGSNYSPTQELVDSYGMVGTNELPLMLDENGDPAYDVSGNPTVNLASGYNDYLNNKWVGREPRFYASINYSGAQWRGRALEFWAGGLDGKKSMGTYSRTGYLMRKMSGPDVDLVQQKYKLKSWIFFRLGEQYLNYAEALNEYGGDTPHPDVFKYVNLIRKRAGMPDLPETLTKDEMRIRIRVERKIELAFETHRYFDCKRWRISHIVDNREIHGLNIDVSTDDFYSRKVVEKRVFEYPKHYLFPIPQDDISRSQGALLQSPGWN